MGERALRAYAVAWRQWKEGGITPAAQPCGFAGGGAMGEAKRPAKLHAWEFEPGSSCGLPLRRRLFPAD